LPDQSRPLLEVLDPFLGGEAKHSQVAMLLANLLALSRLHADHRITTFDREPLRQQQDRDQARRAATRAR
jgi:hypothetical protein